ncbi:MAG: TrkA C-terminal domain-containing protein [Bacteroidota bacterium]
MVPILSENPLLLLFLVAALGYGVGNIPIRGSKLGVAAVLFIGLAFGALDESLRIPNIIFLLGLSIFVYTIGLSSGSGFFKAFKQEGVKNAGFVLASLLFAALLTVALHLLLKFNPTQSAGIFAGANTNTPALAGLLDTINRTGASTQINSQVEEAVVGYSLSYPMGVFGVMLAILMVQRMFKIDYQAEAYSLRNTYVLDQSIKTITVEVTSTELAALSIRELVRKHGWTLVFGRLKRGQTFQLCNWDTHLLQGDLVAVVGKEEELEEVIKVLGKISEIIISQEPSEYEIQRIFVSNPMVTGQNLASLNLNEQYSAIITRVTRGDVDLLARGDTVLELGDRIRMVGHQQDLPVLKKLFGDSYQALSQINLLSFGLGMALGLLLGMISFQLPGNVTFKLGFAGGPLIVGLILGALRRTGPVVWTLPYSANLTLRQIGLIFLLATVGIRSGHTFFGTLSEGEGGWIFLAGTLVSFLTAMVMLGIGYKWFRIPFSLLTGMVSNQPAILEFATSQSKNALPNFGYSIAFPISIILKIVIVQILYTLLP